MIIMKTFTSWTKLPFSSPTTVRRLKKLFLERSGLLSSSSVHNCKHVIILARTSATDEEHSCSKLWTGSSFFGPLAVIDEEKGSSSNKSKSYCKLSLALKNILSKPTSRNASRSFSPAKGLLPVTASWITTPSSQTFCFK